MASFLARNGVRIYTVVAAACAIGAHYLPALPTALILTGVAAMLGVVVDASTVSLPEHQEAVAEAARGAAALPVVAPVAPVPPAPPASF
ncbi:hypothetical protein [Streptacidiphilus albus]|uniref:hypothetical protein n=1 Tax=Streptacidiphilus albus TaxID=105425 RepID=UPI00128DE8A5|nr:hypothetical protein [Streptacidiphilus albus]